MRLVHESTYQEIKVGDVLRTQLGELVDVVAFDKPKNATHQGEVEVVCQRDGFKATRLCSFLGLVWIEREDQGYTAPRVRKGKTLQVLPDGAPRRLADFKNAWRKMTPVQRAEAARFILYEGPELDAETAALLRKGN